SCASNSEAVLLYSGKLDVNLDDNSVIFGRVVAKDTNEPVINANIIIDSTLIGAAVDYNGNYKMSKIPPGIYNIKASCIGFDKAILFNIKIEKGHRYLIDFFLQKGSFGPLLNEKTGISL
ncbi:MAG: carboxypeptidase-like regulatory domain-containing protein, partial [Ignavibacteriaceae bacterium]|nr:carboxypeptidase-like regulatory domain-containing protein [Ignavibacteriaceae bacterium]